MASKMSQVCSTANLEITETQTTTVQVEVFYVYHKKITTTQVSNETQLLTVYPCPEPIFKPVNDAQLFHEMFVCGKIDQEIISKIIANKSSPQRLQIVYQYEIIYKKNLITLIKEEVSGDFGKLVVALLTPPSEYLASELHHAIEGFGTDEKTLIEIICTATNYQIEYIKASYAKLFSKSLVDDVKGDTSGRFQNLLVSLLQGKRSENEDVCAELVLKDVSDLICSVVCSNCNIELEDVISQILVERSYAHLKQVFKKFLEIVQCSLKSVINDKISGDFKDGLLAIVEVIENRPRFFAERIKEAVSGWGKKDRQLIRIIVSRCEVDLKEIKEEYRRCYKTCLEDHIVGGKSGWYHQTLLSLVQDNQ